MKRHLFEQLITWKQDERRKPLILMGARQVGKTTLLKKFGETEYKNVVYVNFEENPKLSALFEQSLDPQIILNALKIEMNCDIVAGETLIIFDEVQECPNALNSLKYFCEKANEYHICTAGSLLRVKLIHTKGFPVGKVDFLHLYPLGFIEFLEALNETKLCQYIRDINHAEPIFVTAHDKLLSYLKIYHFVGGMPEAVAEYVSSYDLNKVRTIQHNVLSAYRLDFAKHAPKNDIMKINLVWDSISTQLAKENKKFIYSIIRHGSRAKEFESAVQWLLEAGLIHKIYNISTPKLPLKAYADFEFFKIYLLDVGLLGAMANLPANATIHGNEIFQEFRGSLMENYVIQEFTRNNYDLYYWTSEGKAEVDLVFQQEDLIYPLEIKSGISGRKKSLQVYADKYMPALLLKTSPLNLKKDGNILNCPLYLIGELKRLINDSIRK